jgi:methylglyoxal reductase
MTEMLMREIGGSGIAASAVGLGTWAIGGWMWGGTDDAAAEDAIRGRARRRDHTDRHRPGLWSWPCRGGGGPRDQGSRRDEVVIATKCGLVWHDQRGPTSFRKAACRSTATSAPPAIRHEVEESLRRLQTDRIDLYITHWQDPTTPIPETVETLEALQAEGKILAFAASNTSPEDLAAYRAAGGSWRCRRNTRCCSGGSRRRICRSAGKWHRGHGLFRSGPWPSVRADHGGPCLRGRRPAARRPALLARKPRASIG